VKKPSRKDDEPAGVGVRVVVAAVALGVIAIGVWTAVTGVWVSEGLHVEGPVARVVGGALALFGLVALVRGVFWPRRR
jgi:hypothetical protein